MVIVGAGECGARAAFALREKGYDGLVTLIGEEPHLPYERPPLSKAAMTSEEHPSPVSVTDHQRLADANISLISSARAVGIDRENRSVLLEDGRAIPYEKLLLATGSTPRKLPLPGLGVRCVYLRSYDDALAIRSHLEPGKRVAIVGGGFIGLELAASARKRGAAVTVIEAQPRILMRGVPSEIAAVVHARHESEGVDMRMGVGLKSIEDDGIVVHLTFADGTSIEADVAVIGIGAIPVTALAEEAGLAIENGIAVDEALRSSDPHIFAAGDCCSFPLGTYGGRRVRLEAWRNAQDQGALAARNMLGAGEAHAAVPWFWSDQYDLTLQIAGLADEAATTVRRDLGEDAFILFHLASDGRLLSASGIGPGNAVARDIRLAEMMIARRARPDPGQLAAPDVKLKSLLAA
jgi:3-phenylpropionate/trans-cinnamate dioxygenase ferredoxin reductase subunit